MRPAGADNYLRWRRTIDEHLELRRLTWNEYAMFNWLCTKASPRTGTLRTSWRTLAEQTGLTANHVEKLCRSLKRKCYVWYPAHRGLRGRLVEVAIHKFPTVTGTYTDLSPRFKELPAEVPANLSADLPAELPAEVGLSPPAKSRGSPPGRKRSEAREREKEKEGDARVLRARRAHGARAEQTPQCATVMRSPVAVRDILQVHPLWRGRPGGGESRGPLNESEIRCSR